MLVLVTDFGCYCFVSCLLWFVLLFCLLLRFGLLGCFGAFVRVGGLVTISSVGLYLPLVCCLQVIWGYLLACGCFGWVGMVCGLTCVFVLSDVSCYI